MFPSPTRAALARAQVQACGEGKGWGSGGNALAPKHFICLTTLPSPVPGEAAERRRRSAGEGPRRRHTLFCFVMTSRRRYSSGRIEAVDDASDVRRNTLAIPPYGLS